MKFKFKFALVLSIILHVSLFALVVVLPTVNFSSDTIYYVDLVQFPGGTGGPGGEGGRAAAPPVQQADSTETAEKGDAQLVEAPAGSLKDLTVQKEVKSKMRYPDKESRKKKEEAPLVSVTRKQIRKTDKSGRTSPAVSVSRSGSLSTGISAGTGSGFGDGSGGPGGYFPYAYYIDTLKGKISSAWYSSLVSPGLRGKFVTVVYFKVFRNGSVRDLKLEKQSGVDSLDLSSLRAVENAAPFPPLPADFPSGYLVVHFKFEWEK
jgi:TonB family protein